MEIVLNAPKSEKNWNKIYVQLFLQQTLLEQKVVWCEKYDLFPPIFCVTFIIYGLMHDYYFFG